MIATRLATLGTLAAALLALAHPGEARADFRAAHLGTSAVGDGTFLFRYSLVFTRAAGIPADELHRFEAGDIGTLYNIAGYVEGSAAVTGPFTLTVQPFGVTPVDPTGSSTPIDTPLPNITVTYNGATLRSDTVFADVLSYRSVFSATALRGFAGQVTRDNGPNAGTDRVIVDATQVAVPEPSSLALAGVGLAAGFGVWARRRHGRTPPGSGG